MKSKDTQDIVGGLVLVGVGLFASLYARQYEFGDLNRMGPGYFPVVLGMVLAVLGALIAIPAFLRRGERMVIEYKTFSLVTASLIAFALTLKVLGLVLATVLAVLLSSLADREITWRTRLILSVCVAALTWLVFGFGLSMVLPTWPWSH
jgi:uncharacterized BrkB/YihY/UPF0761 family membrane protein